MAFRCTKSSEEPFIDRHFWMFIDSLEQTTHMRGVVAEPKLPSDHYGYPLAGPYLSPKTVCLGSLGQ